MSKNTSNKVKLGILVCASCVLFFAAVFFIGQKQQLFRSTFRVHCTFKDISGLQVGNNVRFSGINVGVVEDVEQVTDTTVRVDLVIDGHTRKFIKKNAKATIGSEGLMGNKIVVIAPGTPDEKPITNNDEISTAQPVNMDDILAKLKETGDNAASITDNLSVITGDIRRGKGTIGKLFTDSAFAQNIDEAIVNIKQGAGGFKRNMDAASHNILFKGFLKKNPK